MKMSFGATLAVMTALTTAAIAAPENLRVRGTVSSINGETLTVHTVTGAEVPVALLKDTAYLTAHKASLGSIDKDSYIGVTTKDVGSVLVALGVGVFPPSMRGASQGHFPWDKIPDTTVSGGINTTSAMTNGSVTTLAAPSDAVVNSEMTNGSVAATSSEDGTARLTLTYKGGEQTILVPPTAPIVIFQSASTAAVTKGENVFVVATEDAGKITAHLVAVGTGDIKAPF